MIRKFSYYNSETLAYTEYGNPKGFPILVQHGLIASIKDHALFQPLVNAGARIICIARPGYDGSSPYQLSNLAEWGTIVSDFTKSLNIKRFDLLSLSAGSIYSYAIAVANLEHVRNIFVYSGVPALYDTKVLAHWPYYPEKNISLEDAKENINNMYFASLTPDMINSNDTLDSMRNDGFGPALDLILKYSDWGFDLSGITVPVYMQHSKTDTVVPYQTVVRTAELLPYGTLETVDDSPHFSPASFKHFLDKIVLKHF